MSTQGEPGDVRQVVDLRDAFEAGIDAASLIGANTRAETERRVNVAFEAYLAGRPAVQPSEVEHSCPKCGYYSGKNDDPGL